MFPTDRHYTGQRWDGTLALYDYRARYYDPLLGRFISADPLVPDPGNPQALDRYAGVSAGAGANLDLAANISQHGLNVQFFTDANEAAVGGEAVDEAGDVASHGMGTSELGVIRIAARRSDPSGRPARLGKGQRRCRPLN
ncbi:MAG: RHS repeat-associated core domain-containing protein [Thermoflexus sp.]